ncbi:hypothetical protein [Piscirickettsia salmonis]|uniref:hypothetical protein n=1 Tax=Piscirickettsia salmonis TaxID=1238 RepID=UPI0006BD5F97|nr:hypothetical protein [Piscirickettsia salmonis]ALA26676.1 hypothetical protein KW89_3p50 [Piscirickettsia salmonis]APS45889.1 hypothetical protein AVI48_15770 [Piscirickettsia salmonis]APS49228.1 hypothetical protein AVI49_16355 [Piscirickettsia salmonis]QGO82386.1 hypothetical protein Psal107_03437 [Piscirickettsia salmonis]QGP24215.1 hypothetical protein Psal158_03389 [Piscirickettsia salmonis]
MNTQYQAGQPLSMLPCFSDILDGLIEASSEQLKTLRLANDQLLDIDEVTLHRIHRIYSKQLDKYWQFDRQFVYWQRENLTVKEEQEIKQLFRMSAKLRRINNALRHLKCNTTLY